ncbi:Cubilin like protein [Argiope bruennichi]|uniref:Cubilin like protein n=1 Tax=Argiope bruennichi TaxID=94029 RepID=A0A8T0ERK6_ARGBR|nr:Cubilin like protein [Argiope bruennichi]
MDIIDKILCSDSPTQRQPRPLDSIDSGIRATPLNRYGESGSPSRAHLGHPETKMALLWTTTLLLVFLAGCCCWASSTDGDPEVTECELTTGRTLTVIKSAGFPARYGSNVDCKYTVRRRSRSVCSVTFLFNVMDLEQSPNCTKDYLLLSGEKMCGSKPIGFSRTISFADDDQVTMSFHSDNETRGLGYMVTVVQQDCPLPTCDFTSDQLEFVMSSPNYPLPYDNGRTCTYTVQKAHPLVCRLLMKVVAFDVEEDPHCGSDFLIVGGDRLCGVMTEGQILDISFLNTTLTMEFHSDHVTTRDGFQFNVHQELCDISSFSPEYTSEISATSVAETTTDVSVNNSTPLTE